MKSPREDFTTEIGRRSEVLATMIRGGSQAQRVASPSKATLFSRSAQSEYVTIVHIDYVAVEV